MCWRGKRPQKESYPSFANQKFAAHAGPLVLFGHGVGQGDQHLVDAIRRHPDRPIAISLRGTNEEAEIIRNKLRFQKWFPHARFFAAETHPLGSPDPAAFTKNAKNISRLLWPAAELSARPAARA